MANFFETMNDYVRDADFSNWEIGAVHLTEEYPDHLIKEEQVCTDPMFSEFQEEKVVKNGIEYTRVNYGEDKNEKNFLRSECISDKITIAYDNELDYWGSGRFYESVQDAEDHFNKYNETYIIE